MNFEGPVFFQEVHQMLNYGLDMQFLGLKWGKWVIFEPKINTYELFFYLFIRLFRKCIHVRH